MKGLKKSLAVVLAVMTIVLSSAVPAYATKLSGTNNTFGSWSCETKLITESGTKKYYSYTKSSKSANLTIETEYQAYPSGKTYFDTTVSGKGTEAYIKKVKTQQSTLWSFHDWKSSSGTGMTKYTELINK